MESVIDLLPGVGREGTLYSSQICFYIEVGKDLMPMLTERIAGPLGRIDLLLH